MSPGAGPCPLRPRPSAHGPRIVTVLAQRPYGAA